jgi:preprotein translocase subunit SecE
VAGKVIDEQPSEDVVANAKKDRAQRRGPLAGIALFLRQVMAELRKVVTPTRRELLSYTAVVLVFVVIMMLVVSGLDFAFSAIVNFLFGNPAAVVGK